MLYILFLMSFYENELPSNNSMERQRAFLSSDCNIHACNVPTEIDV